MDPISSLFTMLITAWVPRQKSREKCAKSMTLSQVCTTWNLISNKMHQSMRKMKRKMNGMTIRGLKTRAISTRRMKVIPILRHQEADTSSWEVLEATTKFDREARGRLISSSTVMSLMPIGLLKTKTQKKCLLSMRMIQTSTGLFKRPSRSNQIWT